MIRLNKTIVPDQDISFKLSVNSKRLYNSGVANYFFFKIVNDMTQKALYVYPKIDSTTTRFVTFEVEALNELETSTPVITNGEIRFTHEGFHTYTVYNTTNNSHTDDSGVSTRIIQQGKLYYSTVQQEEVGYNTYTPPADDSENVLNNNEVYINY